MGKAILLEIVTPDRLLVSEKAEDITAPGFGGEFGVLPGHTSFLATLNPGEISYKSVSGNRKYLSISWGYVEVRPEKVIILANTAERSEEIDLARAQNAFKRAEERLKTRTADINVERAEIALARALARIQVVARKE
ncbi:MAG: ATP synthase F1 subunit epsilon [Candidatus Schekmanbacteria bacterium RIFCSPLOWO2_12_FULL_38_15]|uniref:ATP synthase epsilon chain n=1 Tax=Candidatus Schekmanbacteria bacterium RIFCSPLOWO2_12_FULL_38_15 TaxID=1817883 RepID=A0A1F7SGA6_9BACT|nr:MAG: ATP synthase F1 subunit epsilon [Candidatus Schekmanbacteria bacterium RIFCSPLOWO2_12_FULL_38_15]